MRLSVNLDDDLYTVAKSLARADEISLSSAINLLIRRSLAPRTNDSKGGVDGTALPVISGRRLVTSADVYRLDGEAQGDLGVVGDGIS